MRRRLSQTISQISQTGVRPAWDMLRRVFLLAGMAALTSGCSAGEVPAPGGKNLLDYLVALIGQYGWLVIPLGLLGFVVYAFTNKLADKWVQWLVDRTMKKIDQTASEREAPGRAGRAMIARRNRPTWSTSSRTIRRSICAASAPAGRSIWGWKSCTSL